MPVEGVVELLLSVAGTRTTINNTQLLIFHTLIKIYPYSKLHFGEGSMEIIFALPITDSCNELKVLGSQEDDHCVPSFPKDDTDFSWKEKMSCSPGL